MATQYLHLFQNETSRTNYTHSTQYQEPYLGAIEPTRSAFYNKISDNVIDVVDGNTTKTFNLKYWWSGEDAPVSSLWRDRINNVGWNTTYCTYDSTNKWYDMSGDKQYCYMSNNGTLKFGKEFKIFVRTYYKFKSGLQYGSYIGDLASLRKAQNNTSLGNISAAGTVMGCNCKKSDKNATGAAYTKTMDFNTWTDFRLLEYELGYERMSDNEARWYIMYNNEIISYGNTHTPINWNSMGQKVDSTAAGYFTLGMGYINSVGATPGGNGTTSTAPIKMLELKIYVRE